MREAGESAEAGVDGMDVKQTREHLRVHWDGIAGKLRTGEYRPAAIRAVDIPKPQGGTRKLGIPNVQDRLIQHAIHQKRVHHGWVELLQVSG